jgi:hypothetical protein
MGITSPAVLALSGRGYAADDGSSTISPSPGRKVITHKLVSRGPGPKRRHERPYFVIILETVRSPTKVGYTFCKALGLKEGKLQVNNLCQASLGPSLAFGAKHTMRPLGNFVLLLLKACSAIPSFSAVLISQWLRLAPSL